MKLNKKGFTLMELLAVVVILAIVFAVAIPSISSSVERSKNKQLNAKIEVIKAAGEIYLSDHKNENEVSIFTLYCNNILTTDEVKDPFNEKNSLCGFVYLDGNEYQWKDMSDYKENCIDLSKNYDDNCDNNKSDVVIINDNRCYRRNSVPVLYYITECDSNTCKYTKKNNVPEVGTVIRDYLTINITNCG